MALTSISVVGQPSVLYLRRSQPPSSIEVPAVQVLAGDLRLDLFPGVAAHDPLLSKTRESRSLAPTLWAKEVPPRYVGSIAVSIRAPASRTTRE